jgi:hypothetical protein
MALYFSGRESVSLSPANLSFAPQLLGTTSAPVTLTLTNNGASALSVAGLSLSGSNSGDFAIADDVAAGGTCKFTVSFTPGAQGSRTATLSVTDDGPASPQQVFIGAYGTVLKFSQSDELRRRENRKRECPQGRGGYEHEH